MACEEIDQKVLEVLQEYPDGVRVAELEATMARRHPDEFRGFTVRVRKAVNRLILDNKAHMPPGGKLKVKAGPA
jgi:hypothetical protein